MHSQRLNRDLSPAMARLHAQGFPSSSAWTEPDFTALLATKTGLAYGILEGQHIVSMAVFLNTPPEAEVLTLCTHPKYRCRGHARSVLDAALEDLARAGSGVVHLEVARDNAAAIQLYRGLGFEQTGCRRAYYRRTNGQDCDALLFTRKIARQP